MRNLPIIDVLSEKNCQVVTCFVNVHGRKDFFTQVLNLAGDQETHMLTASTHEGAESVHNFVLHAVKSGDPSWQPMILTVQVDA